MDQVLVNGRIFDGETILDGQSLILKKGKVLELTAEPPSDLEQIDLQGGLLAPGFVDVQVNGGGGIMLNNQPDLEALKTIAEGHRPYGTTAMTPTLISDSWQVMEQAAEATKQAIETQLPGIRGIHFEGPYLNKSRKGVHSEEIIREVDERAVELLSQKELGVVVTTLAPESVPTSYIQTLADAGIRVCAGHTAGTYEEIRTALDHGLTGFTHLYNAMSPLTGREPGVVGTAIDDPNSWIGIIADGYHVHAASLRIALKAKPKGKIMLVTDAMATVGAKNKQFDLYGETIYAVDGRCATADGTLAGSDLDMAGAVRYCLEHLDQPLEEALRMASLYPAEFLGLADQIGRIRPGFDADLVLLDEDLQVTATWIRGDMARH